MAKWLSKAIGKASNGSLITSATTAPVTAWLIPVTIRSNDRRFEESVVGSFVYRCCHHQPIQSVHFRTLATSTSTLSCLPGCELWRFGVDRLSPMIHRYDLLYGRCSL